MFGKGLQRQLQFIQDELDELQMQYDLVSESIRTLAEAYHIEIDPLNKLNHKRKLDKIEDERDRLKQRMISLEMRMDQSPINDVFDRILQLNYVEHIKLFNDFVTPHHTAAFVIHGQAKYGMRFLLKRIRQYIAAKTRMMPACIRIDLSATQKFSFLGSFNSGSVSFDVNTLWNDIGRQVGCNSSPAEVAARLLKKWERESIVLILDKLDLTCDFNLIVRDFWIHLSKMMQNLSFKTNNLFILMFVVDDSECLNACETELIEVYNPSWTPEIPVKLPIVDRFAAEDIGGWITDFCDLFPFYLTNCGPNIIDEIIENSENGYIDLVIRCICTQLCQCKFDDGTLEGILIEWLNY